MIGIALAIFLTGMLIWKKNVPASKKLEPRLYWHLPCQYLSSIQGPSPTQWPSTRPPSLIGKLPKGRERYWNNI